jgi:hypothetical protein
MRPLFYLFSALVLGGCLKPPAVETDRKKYEAIVSGWDSTGLVQHFPRAIPTNAKSSAFAALPGYLQGGAWIQLRAELPADEVQKIYDEARQISRQHHDGGNATTHTSGSPDEIMKRLPSTYFYTSGSEDETFPSDYRVFIFDARSYGTDSSFEWNHGTSRGVAVSLKRNEVVYWAESW